MHASAATLQTIALSLWQHNKSTKKNRKIFVYIYHPPLLPPPLPSATSLSIECKIGTIACLESARASSGHSRSLPRGKKLNQASSPYDTYQNPALLHATCAFSLPAPLHLTRCLSRRPLWRAKSGPLVSIFTFLKRE